MKEQVTITIKEAIVNLSAVRVGGPKKPINLTLHFPVTFRDNRDFTESELEALCTKELKPEYRLAWIDSYAHETHKRVMSIEHFIGNSDVIIRASKADGGTGRTREPIISREIQSSTVKASIVPVGVKKPVERVFTFGEALTESEAEKAVTRQGKKDGFRLAWIDSVESHAELRAMKLMRFMEISTICDETTTD